MRQQIRDALAYWEPRRLWYNLALLALVVAWIALTWPHFRPAFKWLNLGRMIVLALLANLCYSAVYLVEAIAPRTWPRGALWLGGTLLALLFACYWIADEIYPFVNE